MNQYPYKYNTYIMKCDIVNIIQMHMKMQQIQVTFQTPTRIYIPVKSNQIGIVIIFLNTFQLCDFDKIYDGSFIFTYYTFYF